MMKLHLLLLALLGCQTVLAQYKIRYIYSDYTCSTLVAVKSQPLWENEKDDKEEEEREDGSQDTATQLYNECVEELGDDSEQEVNEYGYANCQEVAEEENREDDKEGENKDGNGGGSFAGVVTYEKIGCSMEIETVSSANKVMIAEYEDGCPNDGGEPMQYVSMTQECMPFAVATNRKEGEDDKENEENYDQAQLTYSYYAIQCNSNNQMSTLQCKNSNCTDCVLTTTYVENECYGVNLGGGNGGEDDKEGEGGNKKLYAQYWCNNTYAAEEEVYGEDEEEETTMMSLPKSAVIAVCSVGGALILGLGGTLAFQSFASDEEVLKDEAGNLQGGGDYQRLAN